MQKHTPVNLFLTDVDSAIINWNSISTIEPEGKPDAKGNIHIVAKLTDGRKRSVFISHRDETEQRERFLRISATQLQQNGAGKAISMPSYSDRLAEQSVIYQMGGLSTNFAQPRSDMTLTAKGGTTPNGPEFVHIYGAMNEPDVIHRSMWEIYATHHDSALENKKSVMVNKINLPAPEWERLKSQINKFFSGKPIDIFDAGSIPIALNETK